MERNAGPTTRVLSILQWLNSGARLTAADIQGRLKQSVSIRTIQRDLHLIENAGLPVQKRWIGKQGYAWSMMMDRAQTLPRLLGIEEYMAALLLRDSLRVFEGTSFQTEIDALIRKLDQIAPEEYYDGDEELSLLESLPFGEVDYSSSSAVINSVIKTIRLKQTCMVTYRSRRSPSPHSFLITPLKLLYHRGGLYIAAHRHNADGTVFLAIDRVESIEERGARSRNFIPLDTSDIRHRQFGLIPGDGFELIKVRFDSYVAPLIRNRKWHQSQYLKEKKNGSLVLSMLVEISPDLVSWLIRWVPHLKVLQPKGLRQRLLDTLKEGIESI